MQHLDAQGLGAALGGQPERLAPAEEPRVCVIRDGGRVARAGLVRGDGLHPERLAGDHRLPHSGQDAGRVTTRDVGSQPHLQQALPDGPGMGMSRCSALLSAGRHLKCRPRLPATAWQAPVAQCRPGRTAC